VDPPIEQLVRSNMNANRVKNNFFIYLSMPNSRKAFEVARSLLFEFDLFSTKHSLRLVEMSVNAAVLTAFDTADICVTTSSQLRPSSSMRATAHQLALRSFNAFDY